MKVLVSLLFILLIGFTLAVECPHDKINDSYPGECGLYVDQNSDGLCDLSQEETGVVNVVSNVDIESLEHLIDGKELKTMTVGQVSEIYGINAIDYANVLTKYYSVDISNTDSFQMLHDKYEVAPSVAKDLAMDLVFPLTTDSSVTQGVKRLVKYPFLQISLITVVLYLVSFILWKRKRLSFVSHKKIWNAILLISFIISVGLGMLLVLKINYGWFAGWNVMKLHVNAGVILAWISLFHILEHMNFWKTYFKRKRK
jgi:hypothetical protein